jgi:hypothetical protein
MLILQYNPLKCRLNLLLIVAYPKILSNACDHCGKLSDPILLLDWLLLVLLVLCHGCMVLIAEMLGGDRWCPRQISRLLHIQHL